MRRVNEEQCGKIATSGLPQAKKDLNMLEQSGHLLSCGGAYISQGSLQSIQKTEVQFLSLPRREASPFVLKNLQVQESCYPLDSDSFDEKEESSPRYVKKRIHPDEIH